ncbi:MAG: hypothetical protein IPP36_11305 [Nitrosomonadales bacterium]|nr:hypothetical protein [Nitrosomonadales bacterium]
MQTAYAAPPNCACHFLLAQFGLYCPEVGLCQSSVVQSLKVLARHLAALIAEGDAQSKNHRVITAMTNTHTTDTIAPKAAKNIKLNPSLIPPSSVTRLNPAIKS